jgi:haloacetate dehalogenase
MFDTFVARRIAVDGTEIATWVGGNGTPVLLLHGYPQTHAIWHRVAPVLVQRFTVVATDLRGYGDSGMPDGGPDHSGYSKRAMALDQIAVMAALGFERFAVVGHDRGARVAYRMALDHPERVTRVAVLDVIPTIEMWDRLDSGLGLGIYHWMFLAQPGDLPETMIGRDPDDYLERTLAAWTGRNGSITAEALAEYRRSFRRPEAIHAACEDYRAGAGIDVELDAADRSAGRCIACPVLALWGQTWLGKSHADPLEIWRRWADTVTGYGLPCGHFIPEEAPEELLAILMPFLAGAEAN